MTRIRVVVTAEDIARGKPGDWASCPLARGLHRAGFPDATVGITLWSPAHGTDHHGYRLSHRAKRFRFNFDDGQPVQPATFYLEGPDR